MIPEFAEIVRIVAPSSAANGPAAIPINGTWLARVATGSDFASLNTSHGTRPLARVENATAKINTVKIRVSDVRGTIVAGRRVSWAACEIDSRPTKEMIAREEPYM